MVAEGEEFEALTVACGSGTGFVFELMIYWQEWLEEHGDLLFKFARLRLGDPHVAEDLVQETFMKAIRAFDRFRGESSVRTWLFQILKNEINGHFRSESRRKKREIQSEAFDLGQLLHPEMAADEFRSGLEKSEFWNAVQACFEKVPEHLLETFLYRMANPDDKIEDLCKALDIN